MREKPISGEFYQHFKGKLYQIKMTAFDCETNKELVVYQAMYPPYSCWVRDLEEFMSLVDKEKYPDASQEFRFEKIIFPCEERMPDKALQLESETESSLNAPAKEASPGKAGQAVSDAALLRALKTGQPQNYLGEAITAEEVARRGFLQLLDAETFREKRQIFIGLKQYMDKRMLSNIAVALDIVLEEGDEESQYESLMHCMEAFERYEGGRLR